MNTKFKQFFTVCLSLIVLISPAWGITYGEFDDYEHPFVAAVVGIDTEDEAVRGRCSGALIQLEYDRTAVLTAGHCADFWFAVGNDAVGITFYPLIGGDPHNSMANSLDPENYFIGGTVVLHPDYGPPGSWNPQNDLAMVIFNSNGSCESCHIKKSPIAINGKNFVLCRIQINQITPITLEAIDEKNRKISFKMATIPYSDLEHSFIYDVRFCIM